MMQIIALSQKNLVIQKLQKLKEVTEKTWHEAHRIYRDKDEPFIYKDLREIFLDAVKNTAAGNLRWGIVF